MTDIKSNLTKSQIETIAFMMANHIQMDSIKMTDEIQSYLPQLDSYSITDLIMGAVNNEIIRQLSEVKKNNEEIELVNFYIESLYEDLNQETNSQSTH